MMCFFRRINVEVHLSSVMETLILQWRMGSSEVCRELQRVRFTPLHGSTCKLQKSFSFLLLLFFFIHCRNFFFFFFNEFMFFQCSKNCRKITLTPSC